MIRFIKSNKLWLSLLGLAVIIVFFAFLFRPKTIDFNITAIQALKLIDEPQMQVSVSGMTGKQLIDIRSAELFAQGHPELAINIPMRYLLNEESIKLFDRLLESGQETVIYGSDELQATAPFLLLQQLGYTNVKYLHGGMTDTGVFRVPELASIEVSVVDTSFMRKKPELAKAPETEKKKPQVVVPVRKEASSGGGC